ncbi:MAG: NTP transferase domain-containing protein, partial [Nanoarchaeota archaeon]|nr:NTP transferase domain-containing protein [Nanoarchaeota archaeon]
MDALILSGGFGTRLYPLTENIPKALVNVNNKPAIDYILEKIENLEGLENIHIVSNNKFYLNFLEWKERLKAKNKQTAEKIKIFNNGVNKAKEIKGVQRKIKDFPSIAKIEDDLLILACDNLFDFDLSRLISFKKE